MSIIGSFDKKVLSGNVTTDNTNSIVTGIDTLFNLEIFNGDYIIIDRHKYQVENVIVIF